MSPPYFTGRSLPPPNSSNSLSSPMTLVHKNECDDGKGGGVGPNVYVREGGGGYIREGACEYIREAGGRGGGYIREGGGSDYYYGRGGREDVVRMHTIGSALDDSHKNPNKIFVGGLGMETTTWKLRNYMKQFGRIIDAAVVTDKHTGSSRGFGFCSFASEESVNKCMQQKHKIDGVPVEIRRAVPRSEAAALQANEDEQNAKLFVGGIPLHATEAQVVEFFEQFGAVKSAMLMYDKVTHKQRGFAFIVFCNAADADKAIGEHKFLDNMIEIKKAAPRDFSGKPRRRLRDIDRPAYYRDSRYGLYSPHSSHTPPPYRSGYYISESPPPINYGYYPHHHYGRGIGSTYAYGGNVRRGGEDYKYSTSTSYCSDSAYDSGSHFSPHMEVRGGGGGTRGTGEPYRHPKYSVGGSVRAIPY